MIINFADTETQRVWQGERSRKLPSDIQDVARRKLRQLYRVSQPAELRIPRGNRFEELKGSRKGTYSIRINDQWRICFTWSERGAENVRIEDYH
ncbi:proteic killer suppression protein [Sphingomonas vulcanisoli]|uniref:Proteic killer suppression protein n=1 Tax=Sphingomonas vulcanisoli TaxID=1658060 RepID=A0ABX0TWM3_9SPHN|nr:type II toxin-antitoxin system RelE/ParE family toxin [Sphingomonas vulcanisoli]NIJ09104.1 proteic killer suppression protein [Sphingomonas vulcanisoli]